MTELYGKDTKDMAPMELAAKVIASIDDKRIHALEGAIRELLEAMEIQIHREKGEFHMTGATAWFIWEKAMNNARALVGMPTYSADSASESLK